MTKFFKNNKLLILILLIALGLRFYKLGSMPALNADEAALGYNAYSLIETGLDEHSNPWPIHFESFGDYKPALLGYIILPFVGLFGLNEWAVRSPAAFLGVLNILVIWLLVKNIFTEYELKIERLQHKSIKIHFAELAALFLAISPWHIHFSRGAWEVNVATFFITAGLLFFIRGIKNHVSNFAFSVIFFVLSLYTYHAARLIVPLLGVGLLLIYFRELLKLEGKKVLFGSALLGLVLLTPLTIDFMGPAGSARASGVSIFSDRGSIDRINEKRGQHSALTSVASKSIHNKPFEYTLAFSENYLEHFWGEFLFLSGDDIQRNKIPEFGVLYTMQFPLLIISFFVLSKKSKKMRIILWWLLISPVAAAITFQSPHALRAQNMVIPLSILSAYGLFILLKWLAKQNKHIKNISLYLIIIILTWSTFRYIHQYFVHTAKTYPFSSQHGVKELVSYLESRNNDFKRVIITDRYDQPYILFLFYLNYPPKDFQADHVLLGRDKFGFSTVPYFGKYEFTSINWNKLRDTRGSVIVGTDDEINEVESNVIKTIYFPNGDKVFEIVDLR